MSASHRAAVSVRHAASKARPRRRRQPASIQTPF